MEKTFAFSKTTINSPTSAMQAMKKRKRAAPHSHRLSNKRRRDAQINKRLRALRDLIPNCTQMDKESVLDEAIVYLKCLQLQLQIMPTFAGLCVPRRLSSYPIPTMDLRLGAGPLQLFGLPFAGLSGYGTRFQMPPPVISPKQQ